MLTLPWGPYPLLIGQDKAVENYPYLSGAGETVAIIDQGIDYLHPDLGGLPIGQNTKIIAGANFTLDADDSDPTDPKDTEGHGTAVAGIIAASPYTYNGLYFQGIADNANIVALRQTNSDGVKAALDWVIANHTQYNITVINLTDFIGGGFSPNVYATELQTLYNDNIFMVSPVGNGGPVRPIVLPAGSPYDYGAGAVDTNDVVWEDPADDGGTQLGNGLDFLSPGVNVTTTAFDVAHQRSTFVNFATGTSFAAPHVAGIALLLQQLYPAITPAQITTIIQQGGVPVVAPDGNTYARIDVNGAIARAYQVLNAGNNTQQTAMNLDISSGSAAANKQTLLIGRDDWFKFTVTGTQDMTIGVHYGGPTAAPTEQLISSQGVTTNINGSLSTTLAPGTYYIRLTSPKSLNGTFNVTVSEGSASPPTSFPGTGNVSGAVYDSAGTLYLAYYNPSANNLEFATRSNTGVWSSPQTIDASPAAGQYLSLALDHNELPGVAYYDANAGKLKYAHFNGSTWSTEVVDTSSRTGLYPSLAYDAQGRANISYYIASKKALRFATLNGSIWTVTTLDSRNDAGRFSSLVINPKTSQFAVAYVANTSGNFVYATQSGSAWSTTTVDSGIGGGYISLAFNSSKLPSFSYFDGTNRSLKFAQFNGKTWSKTTIDGRRNRTIGEYTNLSFSGNQAEILYFNVTSRAVFSATGTIGNFILAQKESDAGVFLTQAHGTTGQNTLSFFDYSLGNLRVDDLA